MRLKNNESGNTLLMVIFLVTVITILGITLFTMNISATKQFTNKEAQVQARHLAEMGVLHYQVNVHEAVEAVENSGNQTDYLKKICEAVNGIANSTTPITSEETETGEYTIYPIENPDCNELIGETEEIIVKVESSGISNGILRAIEADITISGEGGGGEGDLGGIPKPEPEEDWTPPLWTDVWDLHQVGALPACENSFHHEKCQMTTKTWTATEEATLESEVYSYASIYMSGNSSSYKPKLYINNDLFYEGSLTVSGGTSSTIASIELVIKGDFYMNGTIYSIYNNYPIVVCGNMSSETSLGLDHKSLYVKGKAFENNREVDTYSTIAPGAEDFVASACGASPTASHDWSVQQQVNPEYK